MYADIFTIYQSLVNKRLLYDKSFFCHEKIPHISHCHVILPRRCRPLGRFHELSMCGGKGCGMLECLVCIRDVDETASVLMWPFIFGYDIYEHILVLLWYAFMYVFISVCECVAYACNVCIYAPRHSGVWMCLPTHSTDLTPCAISSVLLLRPHYCIIVMKTAGARARMCV